MANKFRGTTWNNASFGPKIQIRRSIDLAELSDFGSITDNPSNLPTSGSTHRGNTKGAKSATKQYTDLSTILGSPVVDTQDMGTIAENTSIHRIWSSDGAIVDESLTAALGLGNPAVYSYQTTITSTMLNPDPTGMTVEWEANNVSYSVTGATDLDTLVALINGQSTPGLTASNVENQLTLEYAPTFEEVGTNNTLYWRTPNLGIPAINIAPSVAPEGPAAPTTNITTETVEWETGTLTTSYAQPTTNPQTTQTLAQHVYLGTSSAVNDSYYVFGGHGTDGSKGSAYVYDSTNNQFLYALSGANDADQFGYSAAIDGTDILIGQYSGGDPVGSATGIGAALLYDGTDGTLTQTYRITDQGNNIHAGKNVAISGNNVVLGSSTGDTYGSTAKAWIFDKASGNLMHTIVSPQEGTSAGNSESSFGDALAVNSSYVAVGAWQGAYSVSDGSYYNQQKYGNVYIFNVHTGNQVALLGGANNSKFGKNIAMSETHLAVTSASDNSIYVYDLSDFSLAYTVTNATTGFGNGEISISNNVIATTAGFGTVLLIDYTTGDILKTVTNPDQDGRDSAGDYFGISLSLYDEYLVVGASGEDDAATGNVDRAGAGYIFTAPVTVTTTATGAGGETWPVDLTSVQFDNKTFAGGSIQSYNKNFTISNDGLHMYTIYSNTVSYHELSTAFDITTATFKYSKDMLSSVGYQSNLTNGIELSSNGEFLYLINDGNDTIFQIAMATPYDWATNSTITSVSASGAGVWPMDLTMADDGTRVYVVEQGADVITEFVLTTPYDITTLTATGNTLASPNGNPFSVHISTDGSKLYVFASSALYEIALLTAFDLSSADENNIVFTLLSGTYCEVAADGSKLYTLDGSFIRQYSIDGSTPDVLTIAVSNVAWSANSQLSSLVTDYKSLTNYNNSNRDFTISEDGLHLYLIAYNDIKYFTLSVANDISTATLSHTRATYPNDTAYRTNSDTGLAISSDGQYLYVTNHENDNIRQYTMTTPYDWSTASVTSSLSTSTLDTHPRGITMTSDGKKAYIIGSTNKKIHELVLATPFDISTAYWSGIAKNLDDDTATTGFGTPDPVMIKISGTGEYLFVHMYEEGIVTYQLSTPFDLSTASYLEKLNLSTARYAEISSDGTRVYGLYGHFITQYRTDNTTSTPIAIATSNLNITNVQLSTITPDNKTLNNYNFSNRNMSISEDGLHLYLIALNDIKYYTLSVANDISTATLSHARATYPNDTAYQTNGDTGLEISSNGQYLYVAHHQNDNIRQYTMTTPYDLSTASLTTALSVIAFDNSINDITMTSDGKKAYIAGNQNKKIHELVLVTPFDISTAYWTGVEINLANDSATTGFGTPNPTMVRISGSGEYLYVHMYEKGIVTYQLSTPFDLQTASYLEKLNLSTARYAEMSLDGTKLFALYGHFITQYRVDNTTPTPIAIATSNLTIGTAQLSTITTDYKSLTNYNNSNRDFTISEDGLHLYLIAYNDVHYYTLSVANDLSTATLSHTRATYPNDTAYQTNGDNGLAISSDGQYLYVTNAENDNIRQYTMTTPYDWSTASLITALPVISFDNSIRNITMTSDGKKAYIVGNQNRNIHELVLATPFDISTAYWTGNVKSLNDDTATTGFGTPNPTMIKISGTGEYLYVHMYEKGIVTYQLSTPFDLQTASYLENLSLSTARYVDMSLDGTKLYGLYGNFITQYRVDNTTGTQVAVTPSGTWSMTTGFGTPTVVQTDTLTATQQRGFDFSEDGLHLYLVSYNNINHYTLTSAYDLSTVTLSHSYATYPTDTAYQTNEDQSVTVSSDGRYLYATNRGNDRIRQYTMTTPYDLSTASVTSYLSVIAYDNHPRCITMTSDGKKAYIAGYQNKKIHELALATPFDISTAYWTGEEIYLPNIGSSINMTNPTMVKISGTGEYLYAISANGYTEISLSTPFDLSTAAYSSHFDWSAVGGVYGTLNSDGSKLITHLANGTWTTYTT